ncbi:MAG: DUF6349 family protein [Brachybacterium tyrofermentans]
MVDLLGLLEVITAEPTAAPQAYTTATDWTPTQLDEAFAAVRKRAEVDGTTLGLLLWSHMWTTSFATRPTEGAHPMEVVSAHLGCECPRGAGCQCVTALVYWAWCGDCAHWTAIRDEETAAVEELHDHCWPGWLDLPLGGTADREDPWTQPGAPIITNRSGSGTRAVPGRSPYGGYDLAAPDPS